MEWSKRDYKMERLEGGFVLDSSVIVKWFAEEEFTDKALNFRRELLSGRLEIAVPDLILYEIPNALRFSQRLGEEDIKSAISSIFGIGVDIIAPLKRVLDSAVGLSFKFNISFYDAYFIALAKDLEYKFITADEKLCNKIKALKFVKLLKEF